MRESYVWKCVVCDMVCDVFNDLMREQARRKDENVVHEDKLLKEKLLNQEC